MLSYNEKDRPGWDRIMGNPLITPLNPQADNVIKIQQQPLSTSNVSNKIKIIEVKDIVPNNGTNNGANNGANIGFNKGTNNVPDNGINYSPGNVVNNSPGNVVVNNG